jgi:hypothetical protein
VTADGFCFPHAGGYLPALSGFFLAQIQPCPVADMGDEDLVSFDREENPVFPVAVAIKELADFRWD